jgi:hypothetical protein
VAGCLLVAFVAVERRVSDPLLPPHVPRASSLVVVSGVRWFLLAANYGSFFVLVLYFQHVKGSLQARPAPPSWRRHCRTAR